MKFVSLISLVALSAVGLAQPAPGQFVKKSGDYQVQLRVPPVGLYAGEETDIEFRLGDLRQDDPIQGPAGVAGAKISGKMTMPEMPGMPAQTPAVHAEGVPGDYGVVAYFPHGGDYELALTIDPPAGKQFTLKFTLSVLDEKPTNKPKARPYRIDLKASPRTASESSEISFKIVDSKSGAAVTSFDEAHTKRLHLLVARQDFGWFAHEHPEMAEDGTWTIALTFPSGGKYFLYTDVAPAGHGSQILMTTVEVSGAKAAAADWNLNTGPSSDGGVTGSIDISQVKMGRSTPITIRLTDAAGQPITDLEPWLGAMGHLMIFSQDGLTAVHSHPDESSTSGPEVRFMARFPKAGKYRAFSQFQRSGKVVTLSFTINVKGSSDR